MRNLVIVMLMVLSVSVNAGNFPIEEMLNPKITKVFNHEESYIQGDTDNGEVVIYSYSTYDEIRYTLKDRTLLNETDDLVFSGEDLKFYTDSLSITFYSYDNVFNLSIIIPKGEIDKIHNSRIYEEAKNKNNGTYKEYLAKEKLKSEKNKNRFNKYIK